MACIRVGAYCIRPIAWPVAVCEMTMQHRHSPFVMCAPIRGQSFIPAGCLGDECNSPLHGYPANFAAPAGAAPTRVQSFIPVGCLGGVCNSPLHVSGKLRCPRRGRPTHGDNHSSLRDVWGGECNSPLHGYPAKLRYPRRGRPYMYPANFAGVRRRPLPIIRDCECVAPWPTFATLFLT